MSLPPALKASALSAYRNLYRAASNTFYGDPEVLTAFRSKMRADISLLRPEQPEVEAYTQLTNSIADVLRKNIVQATRVKEAGGADEKETWRLRLTKDTELGDNDTIKNAPVVESSRSSRKREKSGQTVTEPAVLPEQGTTASTLRAPPVFFSALKKAHKNRVIPELKETDLEESFVRGSGPGGQSINKTENNVQLLHKPTGIRVSCQETRSLALNRKLARRILTDKLDKLANPGLSKNELAQAKQRERERRRRKKAKKKEMEKQSRMLLDEIEE